MSKRELLSPSALIELDAAEKKLAAAKKTLFIEERFLSDVSSLGCRPHGVRHPETKKAIKIIKNNIKIMKADCRAAKKQVKNILKGKQN